MRTRFSSCEAVDRARPGAVGAQPHRADPRLAAGDDDRRARAVAEEAGRPRVVEVEHPAHQLGADHQGDAGAPGLGRRGGELERREEAGAGGADVDRPRVRSAEPLGDQRRGVRDPLVGGRGRDQDQVDVGGLDSRALERGATGLRRELGQGVALGRVAALEDPGALGDPVAVDADPRGDLVVVDDPVGQGARDRGDSGRRAHGARLGALGSGKLDDARHGWSPFGRVRPRPRRESGERASPAPGRARRRRSGGRRARAGGAWSWSSERGW